MVFSPTHYKDLGPKIKGSNGIAGHLSGMRALQIVACADALNVNLATSQHFLPGGAAVTQREAASPSCLFINSSPVKQAGKQATQARKNRVQVVAAAGGPILKSQDH